jgi:hypothetical protein
LKLEHWQNNVNLSLIKIKHAHAVFSVLSIYNTLALVDLTNIHH